MATPGEDLAVHIADNVAGLTHNTNCFAGPVRQTPGKAVFCLPTGGPAPEAFVGQTTVVRRSSVQVRVRGDRDDWEGGETLVRSIRDAAHYAALSGVIDVRVQESEPNYLGQNLDGFHEWSINVEVTLRE